MAKASTMTTRAQLLNELDKLAEQLGIAKLSEPARSYASVEQLQATLCNLRVAYQETNPWPHID